jgi:PAS domain S-box-containing protein
MSHDAGWLTTIFETMPLGGVVHAADGAIIAVNPAACSILGLTADQLMGLRPHDPRWKAIDVDGRSLDGDLHPVSIALRTSQPVRDMLMGVEDPLREGKRWILVNATPEFLAEGTRPHRVCVLFEDVTARHAAEAGRREADQRFRSLFERSPIAVAYHRMILDDAGRPVDYLFLDANENYLRLTGVDPRGKLVTVAFPGIERDPFDWIGKFGHVAITGETIRFQQHLLANDRWYDCVGYQTGPGMFAAAFLEITEQKRAELALRASEENLRITLESIGDAVVTADAAGRVTRMNRVAEALTGWSQAAAVGRPLPEVFRIINATTREACANPVERVLASGQVIGLANRTALICRDGSERQIADSGAPIRNAAGDILGVVLVFRDVTREFAMQEQLQQSQKMDAIGQLAGGVAHDFNNMLAGVMGGAEMLQKRIGGDAKNARFLDLILDSANRAADLTRKLLTFARKQGAGSTPVDVHVAVRDTIAILKDTVDRRIRITSDLSAAASLVIGDLTQLQSVFLNVGINATHAMPEGGQLSFRSRVVELDATFCQASGFPLRPGPYIEIEVRDTGCGIRPEHLPHIFEPFFTTKEQGKGTGLGLSAALGAIQQHHGAIQVYSEAGNGTCFRVLLPLTDEAAAPLPSPCPPVPGHGRILLVDDEPILRTTGTAMLQGLGYEVLVAADGAEAVRVLRQHTDSIDLVILDMIMPVMGGRECFAVLRSIQPELRIILASGFSRDEDVRELKQRGLAGFIQKPFRTSDLSHLLATVLQQGPASDQGVP